MKENLTHLLWGRGEVATSDKDGLMSASDKVKLDGIEAGAQVNQNSFSNVSVGNVNISADTASDTLKMVAVSDYVSSCYTREAELVS